MQILKYGAIVQCRNIVFDDNKYDIKRSHPGVVLLPTNEDDENVYCIYMTSDRKRARIQREKYIEFKGSSIKKSFVNLHKIVSRENYMDKEYTILENHEFYDLLKAFYDYQMKLEPKQEEFLEIKNKISVLLALLEIQRDLKITDDEITMDKIKCLEKIEDKNKIKNMYLIKLIQDNKTDCIPNKEQHYYEKLIELCDELNNYDLKNIDLSNDNNLLRNIYLKYRERNYLINVDTLFKDAAIILSLDENKAEDAKKLEILADSEQRRREERSKRKEEKRKLAEQNKIKSEANTKEEKEKRKIENMYKKYGRFSEI